MEKINSYKILLENKVILITGGYGHLGKGIVDSLYANGAKVYVLGRSLQKFKLVFKNEDYSENRIHFIECDISKGDSFKISYDKVFEKEKNIDCIINNAVFLRGQNPETMELEDFNYGLNGTLTSIFNAIKSIIPIYKKQNFGKIINVSSMYGVVSPDFDVYDGIEEYLNPPHYGAAKAGVIQLTKYYANYLGKYNVNVNTVTPGAFPSLKVQEHKEFIKRLSEKTPLNTIGKPEDIGGIFSFLSSDQSNFITGQNFIIDGGWTSR